jgi:dTDP-4-amino-4,6-dideoxygalactose transaminase
MTIPLVDLRAQYQCIRDEIDHAVAGVLQRCDFVGGSAVTDFERAFAAFCEVPACVGVGNGTDALYLALRVLGIGPGDEVITVAHTFIATAEAVRMTGADPVFVDIDGATMLMDPAAVEAAITRRTRAIVPVHLYGQPCDMDRICAIAKQHGLKIVEDAAQAHGARWNRTRVGGFGDAACFSFYPGKNLGAYGDAGAVVSRDPAVVEAVRMLANHGRKEKYTHEIEGVNSRMDTLNAAVLGVKLSYLEEWNRLRQRWAAAYGDRLGNRRDLELPWVAAAAESVWHLYVVRTPKRDRLLEALTRSGISGGIHYPVPLHRQPALAHLASSAASLPASEVAADTVLSLPMYPELDIERIDRVCEIVTSSL